MIQLNDLPEGEKVKIPMGRTYLRSFFGVASGGFNDIARVAKDVTNLSRKEFAFVTHSAFAKTKRGLVPCGLYPVPSLGSESCVPNPEPNGKEFWGRDKNHLILPVIHLHTHPGYHTTMPSEGDLKNAVSRSESETETEDNSLKLVNREVNAIADTSDGYFLYQYTGDYSSYFKHIADYPEKVRELQKELKSAPYGGEDKAYDRFARELQRGGGFKTLYFRTPHESNGKVDKKNLERIIRKFPYEVEVTRISKKPKPEQKNKSSQSIGLGLRLF